MQLVKIRLGGAHVWAHNFLKTTCYEKILGVRDVIKSYMQKEIALHDGRTENTEYLFKMSKM